jgi:peptidoglycan hydrolase CwlO-like protein
VIEEFKKLSWDAKIIIARYEQEQSLESAIKKLESKMEQYETVLEDLHRNRTGQNKQVADHYDAFRLY